MSYLEKYHVCENSNWHAVCIEMKYKNCCEYVSNNSRIPELDGKGFKKLNGKKCINFAYANLTQHTKCESNFMATNLLFSDSSGLSKLSLIFV